jgi:hypothetical protein
MAGLEPFPSLLEADPGEPIRFGASKAAVAAGGAGAAPPPPPPPADEPAATEGQPAFPTVGEFARSKLRPRRFGVRRGDHGDGEAPPPPPPEPVAETNGHVPDEGAIEEEPFYDEHAELADELEPETEQEPEALEEHEPVADYEDEPEPELDPEPELEAEDEPEPDQREYVPLAAAEPVVYEDPEPAAPAPATGRRAELVAALVPAVAIPVIVTSIAGWQFGLPFVALSVIAAGWVMSREKQGFFASLRTSAGARTALTITAVVTVLSAAAAIVIASLPDSSSSSKKSAAPAKQTQPPVASKPAPPPKIQVHKKKHHKHHKRAATPAPSSSAPATPAPSSPPVDPATQGLVRVPPSGGSSTTPTP